MANKNCFDVEEARSRIEDERYVIEEFIGEGGMACVYRAKESGTPNVYALKLLKEQFRQREEFLDVFQIEATNMRDLQHPNIVRFYKFVVEENSAYILMENVDGSPLTKYIQRARATEVPFPIDEIVRIMAQIARAISHLHSEGFIHRDVKPGNVLLAKHDGRAYLTDLGIAGAQGEGFVLSGAGTPSYMPYEQQETGLKVDHTVDIYAFAIMLFEMFAGQKPFRAPSGIVYDDARRILIGLHQSAPVPDVTETRPELPEELNAIFQKALAKNPEDRYRNVMDFAQAIHRTLMPLLGEDVRDFENIEAHPMPDTKAIQEAQAQVQAIVQQNRAFIIGGFASGVVVVLLVIAAVLYNVQRAVPPTPTTLPTEILILTETLTLVNTSTNTLIPSDTTTTGSNVAVVNTDAPDTETPTMATELPVATEIVLSSTPIAPTNTVEPTITPTPAPIVPLVEGAEAVGLPASTASLNNLLTYALHEHITLIPLRLPPTSNGFGIQVEFSQIGNATQYGIAFRVQDDDNYLLLYVDTLERTWQVEAWQTVDADDENTLITSILPSSDLDDLPMRLAVISVGDYYQVTVGSEIAEFVFNDWATGSAGLWLDVANTNDAEALPQIETITIDLRGDAALATLPELPTPQINLQTLLVRDVVNLADVVDLSENLSCDAYTLRYEDLLTHQQDINTLFELEELANSISMIVEDGRTIYNRCTNLGTGSVIDPNSIVDSLLDLDDALQAYISANPIDTP